MRRRWVFAALVVVTLGAGFALGVWAPSTAPGTTHGARTAAATGAPATGAVARREGAATGVVARSEGASRVGARMAADEAVADDVIFLFIAALRGRCAPLQAHDLPKMAVLARVPALSAASGEGATPSRMRRDVTAAVNDLVRQAPCTGELTVRIGAYVRSLSPDMYAEAFPDSYFDPGLSAVPAEFKSSPLALRVRDSCTSVAYATLPLDAARPWQCAGLRASARSTVRRLCQTEGTLPGQAADDIRHILGGLPATCQ